MASMGWVGGNDHRLLPYDLVEARRPIASTIKPVLYAAALEAGVLQAGEAQRLREAEAARRKVIDVDDFSKQPLELAEGKIR